MKTAFLKGLANGQLDPHHDTDEGFDFFLQKKFDELPGKETN